jgi:quercetin dioxygenase-like cupin family protein
MLCVEATHMTTTPTKSPPAHQDSPDKTKARWFIKKYQDCARVGTDTGSAVLTGLKKTDPKSAETYERLLKDRHTEIYNVVGRHDTNNGYGVHYVKILAGRDFPNHHHEKLFALIYVAEGRGTVILDGVQRKISMGDCIYIPPGVVHEFIADDGPFAYLAIAQPDLDVQPDGTVDFIVHDSAFAPGND